MSERVSDIVTTPCGLTMPKRCANCPAITRAQEILSEEQDRLHDLGVQALKGIDPNMLSVDVQQEDGSVASVPLSKVLEQYPDEEVAKGLNHANKEVRKSVAEQMDRLEEATKGAQEISPKRRLIVLGLSQRASQHAALNLPSRCAGVLRRTTPASTNLFWCGAASSHSPAPLRMLH